MLTTPISLILASLATVATAQSLACPFGATGYQADCLTGQAQFTVLGEVTNVTGTVDGRFNATLDILCAYSTFSDSPSNFVQGGRSYEVTGFGDNVGCPQGTGRADAVVGDVKIYWLYIDSRAPVAGSTPRLSLFNRCTGGYTNTADNLQKVSNAIGNGQPSNRILSGSNCTLPQAEVNPFANGGNGGGSGDGSGNGNGGGLEINAAARSASSWLFAIAVVFLLGYLV
ncbi:MAG: hypothetical protein SGCHY_004593 [Lobulomycetales sp.]